MVNMCYIFTVCSVLNVCYIFTVCSVLNVCFMLTVCCMLNGNCMLVRPNDRHRCYALRKANSRRRLLLRSHKTDVK